jgi:hypothetical protein
MTIPAIKANLVRFLFPLFLVTGVLYGIDYLTPLVSQNQGAIGFLPYVLFSIALYPSNFKLQDSEPHILFQFKEKNAAE